MSASQHEQSTRRHVFLKMLDHFNLLLFIHPDKSCQEYNVEVLQALCYIHYINGMEEHALREVRIRRNQTSCNGVR
ncbi:hypothetical protein YC2023_011061 [Brassica napus]